jgi:hypothetical protein
MDGATMAIANVIQIGKVMTVAPRNKLLQPNLLQPNLLQPNLLLLTNNVQLETARNVEVMVIVIVLLVVAIANRVGLVPIVANLVQMPSLLRA